MTTPQLIHIPGNPVPKGRPRFSVNGVPYTDKKTRDSENALRWHLKAARCKPIEGPVKVELTFHRSREIPASEYERIMAEIAASGTRREGK